MLIFVLFIYKLIIFLPMYCIYDEYHLKVFSRLIRRGFASILAYLMNLSDLWEPMQTLRGLSQWQFSPEQNMVCGGKLVM